MVYNLCPEVIPASLDDGVDLDVGAAGWGDLQLDDGELVPGVLESGFAAGDDVQLVLQELDGGMGADGDGNTTLLRSLK